MDPQSAAFTPRDDFWRFQADMLRLQQTQADHSDRLSRLERRQEDDARMKSVWGTSSPFPGVLSGTPQHGPLHQPPSDAFSGFDDHSLIGSLHLDADEEPRRTGATSRANSVRFDESANQSHWSHPHRSSIDLIPRSSSSLGAHPMIERTYSHKSDGRQSSTGHSVHSATSGRANSLGIDTPFTGLGTSPLENPGLAPGLFILGSVPSIIRCWLTTNYSHDSLLYAAVCTGSHGSFLDQHLIKRLGCTNQVREDGGPKIKLPVFLPEAIRRSATSRPNSPAPQLPSITIDFTIVNNIIDENDKSIQIFIGSDVLRAHNADILFSSNTMILFDDDHCKLSIPLVRPEDERTFKNLHITSSTIQPTQEATKTFFTKEEPSLLNGLKQTVTNESSADSAADSPARIPTPAQQRSPRMDSEAKLARPPFSDDASTGSNRRSLELRPALASLITASDNKPSTEAGIPSGTPRSGTSPMIWTGSWRRDADKANAQPDSYAKPGSSYQRREQGIKVLRPIKPAARTFSATSTGANSPSPVTTQSRFFDDGRRRSSMESSLESKGSEGTDKEKGKESTPVAGKTRSANPVGGASAFSWLSK